MSFTNDQENFIKKELDKYRAANRAQRVLLLAQLNSYISELQDMQGSDLFTRKMQALNNYSMKDMLAMQLELKSRIEALK